jgi:DNA (cytosine-5)-methyltransferase 1
MNAPPKFIDLCAGCGGLSLGLINAGWRGVFAVEKNEDAFKTFESNLIKKRSELFDWPDWFPCKAISLEELKKHYSKNLIAMRGKVDLLAGGPPCQGFSTFGRRNPSDPRNQIFRTYIHIVKLVRPKMVLIENVRGIQFRFKSSLPSECKSYEKIVFADKITGALSQAGYYPLKLLVRAEEFSVPQIRPRVIIFGICKKRWSFASLNEIILGLDNTKKTFSNRLGINKNVVSVFDALSDLQHKKIPIESCPETPRFEQGRYVEPETAYQKLLHGHLNGELADSHRFARHGKDTIAAFSHYLACCPKGKKLESKERGRFANKKHTVYVLDPNRPAPTVTTLPDDMVHFSEPRILTVREMARLQSFPDWFEFKGKYTTGGNRRTKECPRYTQVGNAVPPLLAEAIGRTLLDFFQSSHYTAKNRPSHAGAH